MGCGSSSVKDVSSVVLKILNGKEWQNINGASGAPWKLKRKLEIIAEAGLPPLHVVSAEKLRELGRIPTNEEQCSVDARDILNTDSVYEKDKAGVLLVFVSHRWLRPESYEPDDEHNTKARSLIEFARWYEHRYKGRKVHFWIDRSCIDHSDRFVGIATLPLYVAACNEMLIYETDDYSERAWCRLERAMAFAFMFSGQRPWILPAGLLKISDNDDSVPSPSLGIVADPLSGKTTVATDMKHIQKLLTIATNSKLSQLWGPLARELKIGEPQFENYRFVLPATATTTT
eukprot:m.101732 g.101732  ORF g.101732 m.101732 type:complete len:288 (+) comp27346_c0_seq1:158-1021(+)